MSYSSVGYDKRYHILQIVTLLLLFVICFANFADFLEAYMIPSATRMIVAARAPNTNQSVLTFFFLSSQ